MMLDAKRDLRKEPRAGASWCGADEAGRRYEHLLRLGFSEVEADHVFESINLPDCETITCRLADLRGLGFTDPVKMITTMPAILGYAIDNIRGKISDLRGLGFTDPVKMITSSPAILGLAIDNIRGKISDLRGLGFTDPVKMITSLPAILGYARERLLLCGGIIAGLDDRADGHLLRLISKPRRAIETVAAAEPARWSDVLMLLREARTSLDDGLADSAPRIAEAEE